MANIHRLIAFSCILIFTQFAHASFPSSFFKYVNQYSDSPTTRFDTLAEACSSQATAYGSPVTSSVPSPPMSCIWNGYKFDITSVSGNSCPQDSSPVENGSACSCNANFIQDGNKCIARNNPKNLCATFSVMEGMPGGLRVKPHVYSGNLDHDSVVCVPGGWGDGIPAAQGCRMKFDREMLAENPDGSFTSYGTMEMEGGTGGDPKDYSCTATDNPTSNTEPPGAPPEPPKPECENGSKGQVNGVDVCIPRQKDNGVETGDKKKETKEDADKKVVTEEDKKTVCKDGKCTTTTTTTTTTTNKATNTTTTTTTTNSKEDGKGEFCKADPKSAQCDGTGTGKGGGEGEKSAFGGNCAGGFTCTGDAIQCAIGREQHKRACKLFDDKSPESLLYEANKEKQGNQAKDLEANETIDIAGRIEQTDLIGGGSGVSDLSITVASTSVTLPFSNLNPYLAALGNLLVAVSMLMAFRIIGRG